MNFNLAVANSMVGRDGRARRADETPRRGLQFPNRLSAGRAALLPVLLCLAWLALPCIVRSAESTDAQRIELLEHVAPLTATNTAAGDHFGSAVALSSDTLVAGARDVDLGTTNDVGAAYVFIRTISGGSTIWTQQFKLTANDANTNDHLGYSTALSGDTALVGAAHDDHLTTNDAGSAYVFIRTISGVSTNWTQQAKLTANDAAASDIFGASVALSGDTALAGAPYDDHLTTNDAGSAYVFIRTISGVSTNWTQQAKLTANDASTNVLFGSAVALSGDSVVVGAPEDDVGTTNTAGAAYVFTRTINAGTTNWTQQAKLTASDANANDRFGTSVAMIGDTAVVGALKSDESGAAYVFLRTGTNWTQQAKLTAKDGTPQDRFAASVAMSGDTFVAGAENDDVSGLDSGSVYIFSPGYGNPTNVANYVKRFLYWPDAAASPVFDKYQAAFRYMHLLYGTESNQLRGAFETLASLYGNAELTRSQVAEEELKKGLALNQTSPVLCNLLLDIYYDRTVVEAIKAKSLLASLEQTRLNPPSVPGGFVIEDEITICSNYLAAARGALRTYLVLLSNNFGLANSPTNQPFGYQFFSSFVPTRALEPASYLTATGTLQPVNGSTNVLFSGYKDLVLLEGLLRDYGRQAVTLAWLEYGRNKAGDLDRAKALITESQWYLYLHGGALLGAFPSLDPADTNAVDAASGLFDSIASVNNSLMVLSKLQVNIENGVNPLDFQPDFLMLVQKFAGQSGDIFDSFDALQGYLNPTSLSSPLRYGKDLLTQAHTAYDSYRGFQDQLQNQLRDTTYSAHDRLYQIVGAYPGDMAYETPENNEGSEIWLQLKSIEAARLRIEKNTVETSNLDQEIQIEIDKNEQLKDAWVQFGEKQKKLVNEISHWRAAQKTAQGLADAFSPDKLFTLKPKQMFKSSFPLGRVVAVVNALAQGGMEMAIGDLEADKEKNAADQQGKIAGIESEATINKLRLRYATLAVDSQEAALLLIQEVGRLTGLYGEIADMERLVAETQEDLASRYFADPVHHLRSLNNTLMANLSFDEAQKWLYFMARALEYKWNTPFANYAYLGKLWSTASLYKLRNADELERFYQAMVSFNALVQLPQDDYFDWFSVREDFLGYKMYDETGTNVMYYADPANPSGPVNLTAIQAFRSYLKTKTNAVGNVVLNFSTRRELPGGTFYRGPRFSSDLQTVLSAGLFLDKIKWMKISLPGSHTTGRTQLAGELTYGGTSFIRNFDVGTFHPTRPDRLQDEETAYSTRYWYFHAPSAKWRFSEALKSPVTMAITNNSEAPPSVAQIDIFKERSVATTGWTLSIPTKDLGVTVLKIDELDDVKLYFYHYAVSRQMPEGAAAMAEGQQAPSRTIPFPYNLKYEKPPPGVEE